MSKTLISFIESLIQNINFDLEHAFQVRKLSLLLFDNLSEYLTLDSSEREYLESAALMHDVGLSISTKAHHKHSQQYILSQELPVDNIGKIIIADISRYHRKQEPLPKHKLYSCLSKEKQIVVDRMSSILRLADGLDRSHQNIVKNIVVTNSLDKFVFTIESKYSNLDMEIYGFDKKKNLFEKVFQKNAVLEIK